MSLISEIEKDALAIKAAIKYVFNNLKAELVSFLSKGASAIAASIEAQLPKATPDIVKFIETSALGAVAAAEVTPGDGQVKMAAAIGSLAVALTTKGIALAETELRALLENALLIYKASKAGSAGV